MIYKIAKFGNDFLVCSKFSWDFRWPNSREHSKVHVLKKNITLEQIIFLKKTLYYIKN